MPVNPARKKQHHPDSSHQALLSHSLDSLCGRVYWPINIDGVAEGARRGGRLRLRPSRRLSPRRGANSRRSGQLTQQWEEEALLIYRTAQEETKRMLILLIPRSRWSISFGQRILPVGRPALVDPLPVAGQKSSPLRRQLMRICEGCIAFSTVPTFLMMDGASGSVRSFAILFLNDYSRGISRDR